jgi:hypothetical protein
MKSEMASAGLGKADLKKIVDDLVTAGKVSLSGSGLLVGTQS